MSEPARQLVDLDVVAAAERRLERALELVRTIGQAGAELAELANDPDDPVAEVLELPAGDEAPTEPPPPDPPQESEEPASVPERESTTPPAPSESSQSAAPAASPSSPPAAPSPSHGSPAERRERTLTAVRDAYNARPGEWLSGRDAAEAAGYHPVTVSATARALHQAGELEHNGKGGAHSRYRAPATDGHTYPLPADAILTAEEAAAKVRQQDGRPPSDGKPTSPSAGGTPPRATRSDSPNGTDPADAAREAARRRNERREAADQRRGERARHVQTLQPPANPGELLAPRLLVSLKAEAGTVLELARRLDAPARDVTSAINQCVAKGVVVDLGIKRDGDRGGTIYRYRPQRGHEEEL